MTASIARIPRAQARPRLSFLDRLLLGVFPRWAVRRIQARALAQSIARRSFDATGGGRRTNSWRKSSGDPDTTNAPHIVRLRELARDVRRNNAWAKRAVEVIANNTVGWGIQAKPIDASRTASRVISRLWKDWSDSVACDRAGRMSFAGIQSLALKTVVESGEVLVIRRSVPAARGLPVPLQLEISEPDRLDSARDGIVHENGNEVIQGIEFNKLGERVAYWLFPRHPGGQVGFAAGYQSQRVPADDVLHIFRVDRPGQNRGVSWLASAIAPLHDLDEYEDAQLLQAKIAACFGAFVKDIGADIAPLGQADADDETLEVIEPGMIEYLPPGRDIAFAQPPTPPTDGLSVRTLRRIAAGLSVTYESITFDFSNVNFSSARMARLEHYASVHEWRWHMLIPQLCDPVWRWFMDDVIRFRIAPSIRKPISAEWSPPPIPMLEPEKEGLAYQRMLRSGVMTFGQMCRERGEDPEQQLEEIAEYNEKLDQAGIILDSDPRRTTNTGQLQQSAEAETEADDESSSTDDEDAVEDADDSEEE